jgi:hypothetical protein
MTYDIKSDSYIETPKDMKLFIDGIVALCLQFNLSIAHEDVGNFRIQTFKQENIYRLKGAEKDY